MPNQAVCCPNCGSSACTEYRADSFVCSHCDTTFRWFNPMRVTILQRSSHCSCGVIATVCCTQCNTAICKDHMGSWEALLGRWLELKKAYAGKHPHYQPLMLNHGGMADFEIKRSPGWFEKSGWALGINEVARGKGSAWTLPSEVTKPVLDQLQFDQHRPEDRLCYNCVESLFLKLLRPIETQILKLKGNGRLCAVCCRDDDGVGLPMPLVAIGRCHKCGVPVCCAHCERCSKCQTVWCKQHWVGYESSQCPSCAGLLRRMFAWPEARS